MVCFSIFLPLLKGEMPEGQREFRRKALPRCAGTISRCREAFPKSSAFPTSSEGPRAIAKRFRRVRKVFAMPRSVSEEFGRSSRRCEAFPKSSEGPRTVAKRFRRVRKVLASSQSVSEEFGRSSRHREALLRCAGTISRCREALPRCAGTISRCRGAFPRCARILPSPESGPPISVLLFFS